MTSTIIIKKNENDGTRLKELNSTTVEIKFDFGWNTTVVVRTILVRVCDFCDYTMLTVATVTADLFS